MPDNTPKPEPAAANATADKLDRIERYAKLGEKYGISLVLLVTMVVVFVIPMRDGHLEFLRATSTAVQVIGKSNEKTAESISKLGDAVGAVKDLAEQQAVRNTTATALSQEHLTLTKETHGDVKEIKAVVVPKGTR